MADLSAITDARFIRVRDSSMIYVWSIKQQKLLCITSKTFVKMSKCPVCPGFYHVGEQSRECNCSPASFYKFKRHLLVAERRFARELAWASKSEIPTIDNLKRARELGDLREFESEQILRIEYEGLTLINYRFKILEYLKKHHCPCRNAFGLRCPVNQSNWKEVFAHLSSRERTTRRYMVQKANVAEIQKLHSTKSQSKLKPARPLDHAAKDADLPSPMSNAAAGESQISKSNGHSPVSVSSDSTTSSAIYCQKIYDKIRSRLHSRIASTIQDSVLINKNPLNTSVNHCDADVHMEATKDDDRPSKGSHDGASFSPDTNEADPMFDKNVSDRPVLSDHVNFDNLFVDEEIEVILVDELPKCVKEPDGQDGRAAKINDSTFEYQDPSAKRLKTDA